MRGNQQTPECEKYLQKISCTNKPQRKVGGERQRRRDGEGREREREGRSGAERERERLTD